MTTQKILSTITLLSLNFLPVKSGRASQNPVELASVTLPTQKDANPSAPLPEERQVSLGKHAVSVGFAESPRLHATLRAKLAASGRYSVTDSQQIASTPLGLFVGGFVSEAKPEHGWMDCHARYFVVSQPDLAALQIETVAASVPVMQVRIFRERPELLELAEEACLDQLAGQIAAQIVEHADPLQN